MKQQMQNYVSFVKTLHYFTDIASLFQVQEKIRVCGNSK